MLLTELKQQKGTYAGVKFDDKTIAAVLKYIKDNKIPNGLSRDKIHSTLLYSRKHLPKYKPMGDYDKVLEGTPKEFEIWLDNKKDGSKSKCLVLKYNCNELTQRHEKLMDKHKATYDYPKYDPHITLSYDIGDLDITKLSDIKDTLPKIKITHEYGEDLDFNWN